MTQAELKEGLTEAMTGKGGAALDRKQPRKTEFIRTVKHLMVDRDIENAGELHRLLEGTENGDSPSRALIYGYFNGTIAVQPWFLRALERTFAEMGKPLSEEERARLHGTYIASY